MRSGSGRRTPRPWAGARQTAVAALLGLVSACRADASESPPDRLLQRELGLGAEELVVRVQVSGGPEERAVPAELEVEAGAYVEFVTTDWLMHEVLFEADSLSAEQLAFLERTDQLESPPLLERDARYVLAFADAPPGRYPYVLQGNGAPGRGALIVVVPDDR